MMSRYRKQIVKLEERIEFLLRLDENCALSLARLDEIIAGLEAGGEERELAA